ncbi:MAG: hypothetical protein GXO15_06535 [Crenarchaeota archaeon]|nr:hypothetical protein [Thermoproteota archaeon]
MEQGRAVLLVAAGLVAGLILGYALQLGGLAPLAGGEPRGSTVTVTVTSAAPAAGGGAAQPVTAVSTVTSTVTRLVTETVTSTVTALETVTLRVTETETATVTRTVTVTATETVTLAAPAVSPVERRWWAPPRWSRRGCSPAGRGWRSTRLGAGCWWW